MEIDFGITLYTIKMLDVRRRGATTEAYENNTSQGGATEGNPPEADKRSSLDPALRGDVNLMVDQGRITCWIISLSG